MQIMQVTIIKSQKVAINSDVLRVSVFIYTPAAPDLVFSVSWNANAGPKLVTL